MNYKHTSKRQSYYDAVIELYVKKHLPVEKICEIIPVSYATIYRWIANFASERSPEDLPKVYTKLKSHVMSKQEKIKRDQSSLDEELKRLKAENARLQAELDYARLRAEAYDEMINVAESMFNIPIRKKAGVKQ